MHSFASPSKGVSGSGLADGATLIIGDLRYVVAGIMDDCLRSSCGGQSIVCELYFFAHDLPLLSKFIVPVLLICITLAPLLK